MSASDKRGELRDVILAQVKAVRDDAIIATSTYTGSQLSAEHLVRTLGGNGTRAALLVILAAAEHYAEARVDEAVGAMRLKLATYEHRGVRA